MTLLVTIENWAAFSSWVLLLFTVSAVAKALNVLWWQPWRMERALRAQGLTGTAYRFLYGDLKEMRRFLREAASKPMPLSHDIALRVAPFTTHKIREFGERPPLLPSWKTFISIAALTSCCSSRGNFLFYRWNILYLVRGRSPSGSVGAGAGEGSFC